MVIDNQRTLRELIRDLGAEKNMRWERELAAQCKAIGLLVETQVQHLIPDRRFVFDLKVTQPHGKFAMRYCVLVEVQGGIHNTVWGKGGKRVARPSGHNTAAGISRDCEKVNLAQLNGYRCLLVTPEHVRSGQALKWIEEALEVPNAI